MKSNHEQAAPKWSMVTGVVGAALFAVLLTAAFSHRARAADAGKAASASPAMPSPATPSPAAPLPAATSPAATSPGKGAHESIGVHGHWTIDVKNPDGTLSRHVEFENALCTSTSPPVALFGTIFKGGDQIIAQLLAGATVPGGWEIELGNGSVPAGGGSPCFGVQALTTGQFLLEQSNDGWSTSGQCIAQNAVAPPYCFPTLNPPTTNANFNSVILSGQFTVPAAVSSTQISAVGTFVNSCPVASQGSTATACLAQPTGNNGQVTGAYLTGVAPMPAAITVVAGQSVSVTVQLSFH